MFAKFNKTLSYQEVLFIYIYYDIFYQRCNILFLLLFLAFFMQQVKLNIFDDLTDRSSMDQNITHELQAVSCD